MDIEKESFRGFHEELKATKGVKVLRLLVCPKCGKGRSGGEIITTPLDYDFKEVSHSGLSSVIDGRGCCY